MVNREWSLEQLVAKAEAYCAAAEHCCYDVRLKLQQWGATSTQVEKIIARLQDADFLNEQRYCHAFVHDKLLYQGWGRMKMRAQLQAKRLPTQAIEQALAEMNENAYLEVLEKVLTSKKRTLKSSDPQLREKLIRFCMQRGFTYEEISACPSLR